MFQKINNIVMFVLIAIGVILMIMTMTADYPIDPDVPCEDCAEAGYFVGYSYVLLVGSILAVLAGVVMKAISDPKAMVQSLIGVAAMLVIFGISYGIADGTVLESYGTEVTEFSVRMSDAGLYMFYILFVLSIVAILYSNVSKLLK